jgi:hypothetical protein
VSFEFPERAGELSTYALNKSVELLSEALKDHPDEDVRKALAVIRLVAPYPRQVPWYGATMRLPGRNDSVPLGTVLRNAFESVGDDVDALYEDGRVVTTQRNWFTQRYLSAWRQGKRDYYDYLDHFSDPLRWEAEDREKRLSDEQAAAEHQRIAGFLRSAP